MYDIYLTYYILMGCGMFVKLHLGYAERSQYFLWCLRNQPLGPSLCQASHELFNHCFSIRQLKICSIKWVCSTVTVQLGDWHIGVVSSTKTCQSKRNNNMEKCCIPDLKHIPDIYRILNAHSIHHAFCMHSRMHSWHQKNRLCFDFVKIWTLLCTMISRSSYH